MSCTLPYPGLRATVDRQAVPVSVPWQIAHRHGFMALHSFSDNERIMVSDSFLPPIVLPPIDLHISISFSFACLILKDSDFSKFFFHLP